MPAPLAIPFIEFLAVAGRWIVAAGLHLWKYRQGYARAAALTYEAAKTLKLGKSAGETPVESLLSLAPRLTALDEKSTPAAAAQVLTNGLVACIELLVTLPDAAIRAEIDRLQSVPKRTRATTVAVRLLNSLLDE
jgi:hypothetical protein